MRASGAAALALLAALGGAAAGAGVTLLVRPGPDDAASTGPDRGLVVTEVVDHPATLIGHVVTVSPRARARRSPGRSCSGRARTACSCCGRAPRPSRLDARSSRGPSRWR